MRHTKSMQQAQKERCWLIMMAAKVESAPDKGCQVIHRQNCGEKPEPPPRLTENSQHTLEGFREIPHNLRSGT